MLTSVKLNHNRLPGFDGLTELALTACLGLPPPQRVTSHEDLFMLEWKRSCDFTFAELLEEIVRDHFESKCGECDFVAKALCVSVFFFLLLWLSRGRDCTGFAQWGADTMASIVPFQRGEGSGRQKGRMVTARATIGSLGDRSQTRGMLLCMCARLLCACVRNRN